MCYFNSLIIEENIKKKFILKKKRSIINGFSKTFKINVGDILNVVFKRGNLAYSFEGICISIFRNSLINKDTTVILRSALLFTAVEVTFSYFYNRAFLLQINDYKRKQTIYKRSKLYYLRSMANIKSRVK